MLEFLLKEDKEGSLWDTDIVDVDLEADSETDADLEVMVLYG